jgi:2,3-bisphosphoglycerate-independent phosphoglycerate mutase
MKKDKFSKELKDLEYGTEEYDEFYLRLEEIEDKHDGWENLPEWKKKLIKAVDKEIHPEAYKEEE